MSTEIVCILWINLCIYFIFHSFCWHFLHKWTSKRQCTKALNILSKMGKGFQYEVAFITIPYMSKSFANSGIRAIPWICWILQFSLSHLLTNQSFVTTKIFYNFLQSKIAWILPRLREYIKFTFIHGNNISVWLLESDLYSLPLSWIALFIFILNVHSCSWTCTNYIALKKSLSKTLLKKYLQVACKFFQAL